ncbi:unnamed protein product [Microthlaspi erraticum]|uniref:Uncharacterized protein n=1 Tax=Microthlaspi erraticum TaxID=1685480 RepID=A0A6D2LK46_9BRAS|nr:unnamed protein product [Microthlaspi erraticum]
MKYVTSFSEEHVTSLKQQRIKKESTPENRETRILYSLWPPISSAISFRLYLRHFSVASSVFVSDPILSLFPGIGFL